MNKEEVIEKARRLGIADELKIRDLQIREKYIELRKSKIKGTEAVRILQDEFFLSDKAIQRIIYKKRN